MEEKAPEVLGSRSFESLVGIETLIAFLSGYPLLSTSQKKTQLVAPQTSAEGQAPALAATPRPHPIRKKKEEEADIDTVTCSLIC